MLGLALVAGCLREARAGNDADIVEKHRASATGTDGPVPDALLSAARPSVRAPSVPHNNTASPSERFERLMNSCGKAPELVGAHSWDVVKVAAVLVVSIAEARLLCHVLQPRDGRDVKVVRLTLISPEPPCKLPARARSAPAGGAMLSAWHRHTNMSPGG